MPSAASQVWRVAKREFILTAKIAGAPLTTYLSGDSAGRLAALSFKRENIKSLGRLIRRFHETGFVHGDLVATNIFVAAHDTEHLEFYFMDNDRTQRYPSWFSQPFWKRNLIQLNRMPLAGISLQDRMGFLHAYLTLSGSPLRTVGLPAGLKPGLANGASSATVPIRRSVFAG